MTTQLSVTASDAANRSGRVAQVIAALPVSLHPAADSGERDTADLVAIDGAAGWPTEAAQAIDGGARGVLVVRPVPADVQSLLEISSARNVPVVIDAMWTYNPAVQNSASAFAAVFDDRMLLEARTYAATGSDWDRVLLDQLSLIRAAVAPVRRFRFVRTSEHGYAALAEFGNGARASLTAVRTDSVPESASLRCVKAQHVVELGVPAPETAIPGRVHVSGPDGSNLLETKWETAHRAAWRHLHGLATSGLTSSDLADFSDDVALLAG
ncbi:hypothetical protein ACFFGH_10030 [Lysobacter korlensis]|uniref:ABC transporter substrate-binding protein n=1 Tax=Lysobacter korlensis TaxID=553636 RepID=A0ABV6RP56_9GAMM